MTKQSALEQESLPTLMLAREWLWQSEHYTLAGLLQQAETLLAQVWAAADQCDPDLANRAAWDMAWLQMQIGKHADAAHWFSRITAPPVGASQLWPAARRAQIQMCQALASRPASTAPATQQAHAAPRTPARPEQSSSTAVLQVTNLGCFKVIRDGQELADCKIRKASALFRYLLILFPHQAHKEELMELFWPEAGPQEAAHSLHVVVSVLRRYLGPPYSGYLLFANEHYLINPRVRIDDDSHLFWQLSEDAELCWRAGDLLAAESAYAKTIKAYHGDYYVDDRDLAWAIAEQERLLARYLSALDHQGQILIELRRYEPAIECYHRLIERDHYREDAYRQLMLCYWALGRRSEALQQYKSCSTILANELGLDPMLETQALYRRIIEACSQS